MTIPGNGSGEVNPKPASSLSHLSRVRAVNRPPSKKARKNLAELETVHGDKIRVNRVMRQWAAEFELACQAEFGKAVA